MNDVDFGQDEACLHNNVEPRDRDQNAGLQQREDGPEVPRRNRGRDENLDQKFSLNDNDGTTEMISQVLEGGP